MPAAPLLPAQPAADTVETAAARAAMVARLEESGALGPGPVREALLALPRQILMPQAYVRRSAPDETPPAPDRCPEPCVPSCADWCTSTWST
ncbi:hypothetical protein [Streptomyces cellostaticus]|uniref:hypothetical protein n=1 Tax=Streptomyces cellostaticus TaxID=67285 RepID=UPI00202638C3|nr:hypothetical protein [Streptomyces cellostaticus]